MFVLKVIVEVLVVLAIAYGILNEEELIDWEDEQIEKIKRYLHRKAN